MLKCNHFTCYSCSEPKEEKQIQQDEDNLERALNRIEQLENHVAELEAQLKKLLEHV